MKKLILAALALSAGAWQSTADAQFYVVKKGQLKAVFDYTPDYVTFENPMTCGGIIGEAVDLGLSVKWSSVNVGASAPHEYGNYYSWGETETKKGYSESTYKHIEQGGNESEYETNKYQKADKIYAGMWYNDAQEFTGDNKTTLEPADDAAAFLWGSPWRMPTYAEWEELKSNTTQQWTDDYNGTGVSGYVFTSTVEGHTDASIFLPAAGMRHNYYLTEDGSYGYYWSSSLSKTYTGYARFLYFFSSGIYEGNLYRYSGRSIRPVCPSEE